MFARFVVAGLVTLGVTEPAAPPTRYRIDQKVESKIDLTAFGQGTQTQNQGQIWLVSITTSDSAGGKALTVVLDSLSIDAGMMTIPQASVDSAKGTIYRGFLDGDMKLQSLKASKVSTLGAQFEGFLRALYPSLRRGAKAGDKWTDTLDIATVTGQGTAKTSTVRSFVLGGAEDHEGVPATRLDVAFSQTITGTLETPGGPADMKGTGTGTGVHYLARDGRYLGGNSTSTTDAAVVMASAPSPIPIKSTTTTTISVLK